MAQSCPVSNPTWSHGHNAIADFYPFACDRLRFRLCALFFLSLLAILPAECFSPDCETRAAGPFVRVSISVFACGVSVIR